MNPRPADEHQNSGRILVVEDEWLIADGIAQDLEAAGYAIAGPVASVTRALQLIREEPVDAALLDVNLNGEKSFAVADELVTRGIPFAFSTGFSRTVIPPKHCDRPMLGKPVGPEQLLAAIAKLLAEP